MGESRVGNLFLFVIAVLVALLVPLAARPVSDPGRSAIVLSTRLACVFAALYAVAATSFVSIPANMVGVVRKIYGASSLPEGHLIATGGETGYQAAIIAPGSFIVSPFFNVLNSVDVLPVVVVPNGFYGAHRGE